MNLSVLELVANILGSHLIKENSTKVVYKISTEASQNVVQFVTDVLIFVVIVDSRI